MRNFHLGFVNHAFQTPTPPPRIDLAWLWLHKAPSLYRINRLPFNQSQNARYRYWFNQNTVSFSQFNEILKHRENGYKTFLGRNKICFSNLSVILLQTTPWLNGKEAVHFLFPCCFLLGTVTKMLRCLFCCFLEPHVTVQTVKMNMTWTLLSIS